VKFFWCVVAVAECGCRGGDVDGNVGMQWQWQIRRK
jgi:hypothetical protein